jgi:hypothetical protein
MALGWAVGCGSDEPVGGGGAAGKAGSAGSDAGGEAGDGGRAGSRAGGGGKAGKGGKAGSSSGSAGEGEAGDAGAGAAPMTGGSSGSGGTGGTTGGSNAGGDAGTGGSDPVCSDCNGVCTDTGQCVECVQSTDCTGALAHCNTATNTCVACLPDADDCGTGSYCTAAFACAQGCNEATDCASGVCLPDHTCQRCLTDAECISGEVCGSGTCSAPCTVPEQCESGWDCCEGRCVDTARDIQHCGACGGATSPNTCSAEQFCGSGGCHEASFANLCNTALLTAVDDGIPADTQAAEALTAALLSVCLTAPAVRTVSQAATDILNTTSGQPVIGGGETLLVAGGAYYQSVMRYLENARVTTLYTRLEDNNLELVRASDDTVVAAIPGNTVDGTRDVIVVQIVRDPSSGTFVLSTFGFTGTGTRAAVYYFSNVMLPGSLSNYPLDHYVFEWIDDGNGTPDAADTFTPVST